MKKGDADSFGVYLHIPFCKSKCLYCDFHSLPGQEKLIGRYVAALADEIKASAALVAGRRVASVFFGGGTPSLLTPAQAGTVIDALAGRMKLSSRAEITIEANPESATLARLKGFRAAGVNRVSIGVQSLNNEQLRALGRIHTASQARGAIARAFDAGFTNVSGDLMYALPGQTTDEWLDDLTETASWGLTHLSCYQLTPEASTPYGRAVARGDVEQPLDEESEFFDETESLLRAKGYDHYEVSNYARRGRACAHNVGYWEYRDYVGLGAGAHGKLGMRRWINIKSPVEYMNRVKAAGRAVWRAEKLTPELIQIERLMLGLRLRRGIPLDGVEITPIMRTLSRRGLLRLTARHIRATARGWRVLDSVLRALVRGG